jgi:transposase InsO family protein
MTWNACRETVRKILLRRRDLVVALEEQRRRRPRRIESGTSRVLWGLDLTLVWLLGFIPVWILGVVDYHGSRLVGRRRLAWPTSAAVIRVLDDLCRQHRTPVRLLTDNASILCSDEFETFLAEHNVRHSRIRPAHAWTNGRIERVFRTFKETLYRYAWVFTSLRQIDRWCADFRAILQSRSSARQPRWPHARRERLAKDRIRFGSTRCRLAFLRRTGIDL